MAVCHVRFKGVKKDMANLGLADSWNSHYNLLSKMLYDYDWCKRVWAAKNGWLGFLVFSRNCFFFQGITWGKVVAIYAVAAGLAVDCVRQGHPVMVHTIVDSLGEFVRRNLVPWFKKRGGWVCVHSLYCHLHEPRLVLTSRGHLRKWSIVTIWSDAMLVHSILFFVLLQF